MITPTTISVLSYDQISSRAPDGFYRLLDLSCDLQMVFFKSGTIDFMVEMSRKKTVGFVPRFYIGTGMVPLPSRGRKERYRKRWDKEFFQEALIEITREQFHDKIIIAGHKAAPWFLFNLDMAEEKKVARK